MDRNLRRTLFLLVVGFVGAGLDSVRAQAVIEGTVALPAASARLAARVRYPGQVIQPGPADPLVAVVYLEGDFGRSTNAAARAEMGQRRLQFAPGILPVQSGTTVTFPNYDDLYHNVFSYSKTKRFDLGRYQKDTPAPALLFERAGVVKLYCEIHEHMRGTILVLDTPYFVKTDTNGVYQLTGLPAGEFRLKAWLDEKNVLTQPVRLEANSKLRVDFKRSLK